MPAPAPRLCSRCTTARAVLKRPKNHDQLCRECFYTVLEDEVHQTIISQNLFKRGERVALAASGGKDSTVLAHIVTTLNKRYDYGLDLFLLSIDEGIAGYRDDSLDTVRRNEQTYGIPLLVVSYKQLYGWTMDDIVAQIGTKNNCTFCGVFRRQALDRGAVLSRADKIATGHNADDVAETVLLNILRGDVPRLSRCVSAITGGEEGGGLPRVKPFKYTYEKEIVMYAYFKRLDYFSTECVYAPFAARGFARDFVKDLEAARPSAILDLIRSAENFRFATVEAAPAASASTSSAASGKAGSKGKGKGAASKQQAAAMAAGASATDAHAPASADAEGNAGDAGAGAAGSRQPVIALPTTSTLVRAPVPRQCERCGYLASQPICKACVLLEGLNKGRPGGLSPWTPEPMPGLDGFYHTGSKAAAGAAGTGPAATGSAASVSSSTVQDGAGNTAAAAQPGTAARSRSWEDGGSSVDSGASTQAGGQAGGAGASPGQAAAGRSRGPRQVVIEYES